MRIGTGYDIHKLVEGRQLILGGVTIPHTRGLLGHSDADCLVHAIIDALLGAAALGDIGTHFPDTDPTYKNADSMALLLTTAQMLSDKGYTIANIDSTIIAQQPKLALYITPMRKSLSTALSLDIDNISIKAKTNEGMDATGEGNAIICMAAALINK